MTSTAINLVLGKLQSRHLKRVSNGWMACCPAHTDDTASLSITDTPDRVLLNCFADCPPKDIVSAMGLTWTDLFEYHNGKGPTLKIRKQIKQTDYEYRNAAGELLAVKRRYDYSNGEKYCEWYTAQGLKTGTKGLLKFGMNEKDLPLYRLPELLSTPVSEPVIFAEGEKATDALRAQGFTAVSACGGASQKDFGDALQALQSRTVYLWPDYDVTGTVFMRRVGNALAAIGAQVYSLKPFYLGGWGPQDKDDAYDYFVRDHYTAEALQVCLKEAPVYEPSEEQPGEPEPEQASSTTFNASDLLKMELQEPRWAIPGLLPEGLSLLGGKPKFGKSWMGLGLAVAIAGGGMALGKYFVGKGDVLYLALEDNQRRLQNRLKMVLGENGRAELVKTLTFATEWPRVDEGGILKLQVWLEEHPDARLIIIDTLARIKPRKRGNGSQYDEDYSSMEGLQNLAGRHGVAILVIAHLRKADADDPLDMLNATLGLSGAADAILILKRERGRHDATLFVSGRDVEEQELALSFNSEIAAWTVIGGAAEYRMSLERKEIIDIVAAAPGPISPKEVSDLLHKNHSAVKKLMWQMGVTGELKAADGKYTLPNR